MKRGVVVVLAALLLAPALPAAGDQVYPIVFPVAGDNHYSDTYGDPRGGGSRTHEGIDIMASKMVPVVAAADGTVGWMHNVQGVNCCAMELVHEDGYRSWYIHLNNDTPGTDDGQGWGFAPGIEPGVHVTAGQLIGYVGDSGNAENSGSHLHFELHDQNNTPFNPYPSLLAAKPADGTVVSWHLGTSDGGHFDTNSGAFEAHVRRDSGLVAVGDFDGDTQDEVAVGGGYSQGWTVSELDGGSSDWSSTDSTGASHVLVGDFDGDADEDVALFYPDLRWTGLRSTGASLQTEAWGSFGGHGWTDILVGDFDADGVDEIIGFHPPTRRWWMSRLTGDRLVHSVFTSYGTRHGWQSHLVADIDGDGADELLSFHPSNGTWWASAQGGSPRLVFDASTNSGWTRLVAVDHDGDGASELAMFHPSNGTWWVVDDNAGDPSALLWTTFTTRNGWASPTATDWDGDGFGDLLLRHGPTGRVWAVVGGKTSPEFVGAFVPGDVEGEWLVEGDFDAGLLALQRS